MENIPLRDYFAAKAMQSIIIKSDPGSLTNTYFIKDGKKVPKENNTYIGEKLAKWAYEYADAMIKERGNNIT